MFQSGRFDFVDNSTMMKGRQEIKVLWLPVILCVPVTYWDLMPGGTVEAPGSHVYSAQGEPQMLSPMHVTVTEETSSTL